MLSSIAADLAIKLWGEMIQSRLKTFLILGLGCLCVGVVQGDPKDKKEASHGSDPKKQENVVASVDEVFALSRDAAGNVIRQQGSTNLNGEKETFVTWDECSETAEFSGQVTWDYSGQRAEASLPTKKEDLVPCSKRQISEAFVNFMNKNMKFCIAAASLPATQLFVTQKFKELELKHGAEYKGLEDAQEKLLVDIHFKNDLGKFFEQNAALVEKELATIEKVKILHQGIVGDDKHGKDSYHAKDALRAIDISHLVVDRKTSKPGEKQSTLYQHNVASYSEQQVVSAKEKELTGAQKSQHQFWQAFGACMTHKGGGVISYCMHHSESGLKHQGHMHISLPYEPKGKYNDK